MFAATVGAALPAVSLAVLLTAAPALADPSDAAVSALKTSSIYVGAARPTIKRAALTGDTLRGIKVAIVPNGGPNPVAVARSIGSRLDPDSKGLTVLVFEGRSFGAASSAYCGVGGVIQDAVARDRGDLKSTDDVTSTVADFAAALRKAPSAAQGCSGPTTETTGFGQDANKKKSDHTGLVVFLALVAAVLAAIAYVVHARRRKARRILSDARAEVLTYLDRLAAEVNGIDARGNATAQQALADARQRLASAESQLASADSVEKYAQAKRTTLEGLYATQTARTALGLQPGPQLPSMGSSGEPQLNEPRQVNVQGQSFQGYPNYTPGAPYYYGGGYGVPGGWYGVPFWETLLLTGALTGGFGAFGGGYGGYGAGYDNGYETGYDAGENAADRNDGTGGDGGYSDNGGYGDGEGWGDSGGGGGWDSGGGDWGGDSVGGDFGGGDFGGGDSGGGNW
jgi:hypothetical protein